MKPAARVLFLSLTNNDGVFAPIGEFRKLGAECGVVSPPGFTCSLSSYVSRHFVLPRHRGLWLAILAVRGTLETAVREWKPDLVQPVDDVAAWVLRSLATNPTSSTELQRTLQTSLGPPSGYDIACSRAQFLQLATELGVRAPRSRAAERETVLEVAEAVGYPLALKQEHSTAGFGVAIVKNQEELSAVLAASSFSRWQSVLGSRALLRRGKDLVRQIVWKLAGLHTAARTPFEIQQFITGKGAMRMVVAWEGKVLAGVSLDKLCVHPHPVGNSTVLGFLDNPEMEEATRKVIEALGYSGFAHFDFIVEEETGHAYVIEMNPRMTASTHLGRLIGQDLQAAILRALGFPCETHEPATKEHRPVVRFPRELERDPDSPWLRPGSDVIHDVPRDDPPIFDFYWRRLLRRRPGHEDKFARLLGVPLPEPEPASQFVRISQFLRRAISP